MTPAAFVPIGIVHTERHELGDVPIQGRLDPSAVGTAEIDRELIAGLEGLDQFDFAWLLTWLDRPATGDTGHPLGDDPLRPVPFLAAAAEPVGVFATRYPVRPNPVGLSLVEIVGVEGSTISFRGVDLVDGTVLLDIKPWVPEFDLPRPDTTGVFAAVRTGWYERSRLGATDTPITPNQLGGNS
jgi:tRNA-Thr(GGU) m(6)t(6)A37 methyltransferase TsaA